MGMCLLQSYLLGVLPGLLAPALEDVATGSASLLEMYEALVGEKDAEEWWSEGGDSSDEGESAISNGRPGVTLTSSCLRRTPRAG